MKGEAALRTRCLAPQMGASAWSAPFLEGEKRIVGELVGLHLFCLCVRAGCHPYPVLLPPVLRCGHFSYQALEVMQKPGRWTALWKWMLSCA